jgi:hypothetical protein
VSKTEVVIENCYAREGFERKPSACGGPSLRPRRCGIKGTKRPEGVVTHEAIDPGNRQVAVLLDDLPGSDLTIKRDGLNKSDLKRTSNQLV